MSTPDDDRDGEATTVVPRTPQDGAPPPMSTPPPPPQPPAQAWQSDPRWQTAPWPGSSPPSGGGSWTPAGPPWPYPPSPYPPVAPNPPKGPRWILLGIGALVVVVVIVVAVTVFVTRGGDSSTTTARSTTSATPSSSSTSSPSPTTAANVDPTALKGLLASVADVTQIANNAMMTPTLTRDSPILGVHVDPFSCTGAVMTALHTTYAGAAYTAFAVQLLHNDPQNIDVIQALASLPSAGAAKAFVDGQFQDWQSCDDTGVTITVDGRYGGPPQHGEIGKSANTQGTNVVSISPPTGVEGRQCQHAMSARKNVVVDARVCAPSVGNMGWDLARAIDERITGQR